MVYDDLDREGLVARIQSMEQALQSVTHDLGNFLNAIVSASSLLGRTGGRAERRGGARHLAAIRSATARMSALLDSLRDAGTIDAGCFRLNPNPDDVSVLLKESLATVLPIADARHVQVSLVTTELPWVDCDRERIHQVLSNLLVNALQHTPPGGVIIVGASSAPDKSVRISVSDTGPGIPPSDLPHVFERYWRKPTGSRVGVGLGLHIAKGIVEAHRGQLWVESAVGRGTTFVFTLPGARIPGVARSSGIVPKTDPPNAKSGTE